MTVEQRVELVDEGQMLVRMPGMSQARLRRALRLLQAAEELQADEAEQRRPELLRIMTVAQVQPLPAASVAQARRLAGLRERLLATSYETVGSLAEGTGKSRDAVHVWLSRQRESHRLFTVTQDNSTAVPAFQLDEEYRPKPALRPVLEILHQAALSDWGLWGWFCTANGWLDSAVPADLMRTEPALVEWAAHQYADSLAPDQEQPRAGSGDRTQTSGGSEKPLPGTGRERTATSSRAGKQAPEG